MGGNPKVNPFDGLTFFAGTEQEFTVSGDDPYRIEGAKYFFYSSKHVATVEVTDAQVKRSDQAS